MATFDFRLEMVRKDGSLEEADRFTLEHEDYDGHSERTALQHVDGEQARLWLRG